MGDHNVIEIWCILLPKKPKLLSKVKKPWSHTKLYTPGKGWDSAFLVLDLDLPTYFIYELIFFLSSEVIFHFLCRGFHRWTPRAKMTILLRRSKTRRVFPTF